jgi:membrane protein YdbS with pleckstrin-like domain
VGRDGYWDERTRVWHEASVPDPIGPPAEAGYGPLPEEGVWAPDEVDLAEKFHLEARYPFRKSFTLFIGCVALWVFYIAIYGFAGLGTIETYLQYWFYLAVRLSLFVFLGRYLYWELYRRTYEYRSEGSRLLISKGVVVKLQGSIPLIPMTSIFVKRDPLDLLFGLYQIQVLSPVDSLNNLGCIEGLNRENVYALHRYLTDQLHGQMQAPPPPEYDPETGERTILGPFRNDMF